MTTPIQSPWSPTPTAWSPTSDLRCATRSSPVNTRSSSPNFMSFPPSPSPFPDRSRSPSLSDFTEIGFPMPDVNTSTGSGNWADTPHASVNKWADSVQTLHKSSYDGANPLTPMVHHRVSTYTALDLQPGIYQFLNGTSETALDLSPEKEVIGYEAHWGPNQQWDIQPLGKGYTIQSIAQPTLFLSFQGAQIVNGTRITVSEFPVVWRVKRLSHDNLIQFTWVGSDSELAFDLDQNSKKLQLQIKATREDHQPQTWNLVPISAETSAASIARLRGGSKGKEVTEGRSVTTTTVVTTVTTKTYA